MVLFRFVSFLKAMTDRLAAKAMSKIIIMSLRDETRCVSMVNCLGLKLIEIPSRGIATRLTLINLARILLSGFPIRALSYVNEHDAKRREDEEQHSLISTTYGSSFYHRTYQR